MIRRRFLFQSLGTVAAGVGISLGSGAFTQVEASHTFDLSLAADDTSSQLAIEGTDLASSDITHTSAGTFTIDSDAIQLDAVATFGRFGTITSADTLTDGAFVVRNENQTEADVDVTLGFDTESSSNVVVELALVDPGDESISVIDSGGENSDDVTISDVPSAVSGTTDDSAAEIECGLVVNTARESGTGKLDFTISIEAVRSARTS